DGNLQGTVMPAKGGATPPVPSWKDQEQFSNGILDKAASFDGKSFIDAGNVGGFDDTSKITLGAWIYPTEANGTILSKTPDEPEEKGYILELKDGKVFFNAGFRWIDHNIR